MRVAALRWSMLLLWTRSGNSLVSYDVLTHPMLHEIELRSAWRMNLKVRDISVIICADTFSYEVLLIKERTKKIHLQSTKITNFLFIRTVLTDKDLAEASRNRKQVDVYQTKHRNKKDNDAEDVSQKAQFSNDTMRGFKKKNEQWVKLSGNPVYVCRSVHHLDMILKRDFLMQ